MATKEDRPSKSEAKDGVADPSKSSKRKANLDEIEVDVSAPEPPSKRARRALKKGKALPAKAESGDEKNDKDQEKEKKDKVRSEHSVWIGNLLFSVTPAELRTWLVDNSGGSITDEMITRVKLPLSKDPGRDKSVKAPNKGFAYVDFTDIAGKVAAIALSETGLGHRKLLIKDATSFEGRPKKEKEPEPDESAEGVKTEGKSEVKKEINASRKVFVGNMGFKTTEDDLHRQFEKCGEIEWLKVATFEDTGKCKGYGWIMFKEPEAAAWAVKGFVKVKEAVETEDDFKQEDDEDSDDDEPKKKKQKQQQKQFKTRKWWVNRMMGRELKLELAEDDQVRYKKRFGKDRDAQKKPDGPRRPQQRTGFRKDGQDRDATDKPVKAEDLQVARLTGAVVKHTGTKMTFD